MRLGGGHLHLLGDGRGPHVEARRARCRGSRARCSSGSGESEDSSSPSVRRPGGSLDRLAVADLRIGVGQGHDDRARGHGAAAWPGDRLPRKGRSSRRASTMASASVRRAAGSLCGRATARAKLVEIAAALAQHAARRRTMDVMFACFTPMRSR